MQLATNARRSASPTLFVIALAVVAACSDAVSPDGGVASDEVLNGRKKNAPPPPPVGNPIAGASLYVSPTSNARATADAWRSTRPADAAQLDKIAGAPQARWFGDWNADVRGDVDRAVASAHAANAVPVLAAYNIPMRDCGSYSGGGAPSADAYRRWISDFAAGIGQRRAIVILEPDALAGMGCLSPADQSTRSALVRYAIQTLRASAATTVYVDAGNHRWHSPSSIADRLLAAGIELANGFALNVSNFFSTLDETAYGNSISSLVGGKHYVIDTSRNGLGPTADAQWCNPDGRALGARPTTATGSALVDAFLWVKPPGDSDGSCNGNPAAGTWMPEYALGLAQRASY